MVGGMLGRGAGPGGGMGALGGLLEQMQRAGFGDEARSWVGTGQNMPISPDALSQIFGQGEMGQIAERLGMSRQDAAGGMAQMLPDLVNEMTPQGQLPANDNDLVSQVLASLQKSDALKR